MVVGRGSLTPTVSEAAAADANISYLGRLAGSEVWDAYLASDIVVVPSRYEPWGLVVNEAMACGRPVVATDRVGCVDNLVVHEETGLVVPGEAPHALADAIGRLASNARLREEMGPAAARIISRWTLQNKAEIIVHCWSKTCDCH